MSKEEFYAEERAYEAQIEAYCEQCEREEDEWQAHGFRDEADYNQWRYGSSRYL